MGKEFLSVKDMLDYFNFQATGKNEQELAVFLVSRFYQINEKDLHNIDSKYFHVLFLKVSKYMEAIAQGQSLPSFKETLNFIGEKIENKEIINRFELMDL